MQQYKSYRIYTRAVSRKGVWHGRAVILDPEATIAREIQRIETVSDLLFLSKEEAEDFAFKLCKAWIDRRPPSSNM